MGRKPPSRPRRTRVKVAPTPAPVNGTPFPEPTPAAETAPEEKLVLICGREDGRPSPWVSAGIPAEKCWDLPFDAFAAMFLEPMFEELKAKRAHG